MDSEFPPNSEASKRQEEKDIKQVISGKAIRRKKSLRKRFSETFVAGDLKTAVSYAIFEVMVPEAKDMILEAWYEGMSKLFFGESSRRRRGSTSPQAGPTGYVSYNRYAMGSSSPLASAQRAISRRARAQHDFDEILLDSRSEAEQVIDQLFDVVSRYETATVADLYELVGLASNHTDHKWGWTDLRGAGVSRTSDGYLLDLPDPHPVR